MQAIAEGLAGHKGLRKLDLAKNGFGDVGAQAWSDQIGYLRICCVCALLQIEQMRHTAAHVLCQVFVNLLLLLLFSFLFYFVCLFACCFLWDLRAVMHI